MDQTVRLWDAASGSGRLLENLESIVFGIAFSPDGRYLVAWGDGGVAWRWDAKSLQRLPIPRGTFLGFTSDSRELLMQDNRPRAAAMLLELVELR